MSPMTNPSGSSATCATGTGGVRQWERETFIRTGFGKSHRGEMSLRQAAATRTWCVTPPQSLPVVLVGVCFTLADDHRDLPLGFMA